MLMRTDPFRELDRLANGLLGTAAGTWSKPTPMPMDAYRDGESFVVCFDLPGIDPSAIELEVERNVLTVKAERRPVHTGEKFEMQINERPSASSPGSSSSARPWIPTASTPTTTPASSPCASRSRRRPSLARSRSPRPASTGRSPPDPSPSRRLPAGPLPEPAGGGRSSPASPPIPAMKGAQAVPAGSETLEFQAETTALIGTIA